MVTWKILTWNQVQSAELYAFLTLRQNVFIIEQNCPYPELDGKDKKAIHIMATDENGQCLAYARVFKEGDYFKEESIGRVCTHVEWRKKGLGRELMKRVLDYMDTELKGNLIAISAQSYLVAFYSDFGFISTGDEYLEDDIPHTRMVRKKPV